MRPATTVSPLVCGEDAFAAVARALRAARSSINLCFWGLDPAMLLERGTENNWDKQAILGEMLLEKARNPAFRIRMVVWDHYKVGIGSGGSGAEDPTDADLGGNSTNLAKFRELVKDYPNIEFEMTNSLSTNPIHLFPSFHQKSIIIDIENPSAATAFVMGHNMLVNYWSSVNLRRVSPRRQFYLRTMDQVSADQYAQQLETARKNYEFYRDMTGYVPPHHAATVERFRQEYEALRDLEHAGHFTYRTETSSRIKPYLDISTQIWGKAVVDVYANFSRVWKANTGNNPPAAPAVSRFSGRARRAPAQVAATFPKASPPARDIEKLYLHAMQNADRYILMVNQYFRNWPLTDRIIDWWATNRDIPRKKQVPMMIVTNDWNIPANIDELGFFDRQSVRTQAGHDGVTFDKFNAAGTPISMTTMLNEEAPYHSTVYVHAKLLLVDDVFYSIGSANYNRRGMESDPELNIGVLDGQEALRLRREIMNILVGDPMNEFDRGNDPMLAFAKWQDMVAQNSVLAGSPVRLPHGRVVNYTADGRDPNDERANRLAQITPLGEGGSLG
ncbi:phospholipase D-like domain-containing protein [Nereida sp. MMG025]|uniref:phospholipase D-like domain-containing protein n=1 Tax=Nereida sp. MMG025 TaxID=2909981 RepID=UPI001F2D30B7|nr:phospholipase D-like domain-containing protein [Nereida sp. MMG025]MCF6443151.1 phospholipase D-like domain-containing protein [Nereida sp. MMG025]